MHHHFYPYEEFKQAIANLPIRYSVILDYDLARQSLSHYEEFEVLKDDPNMIVRTGGVEANAAHLTWTSNPERTPGARTL